MGKVKKFVEISHDIKRALGKARDYIKEKLKSLGRDDIAKDIDSKFEEIEEEEISIALTRRKTKKEIEEERNGT